MLLIISIVAIIFLWIANAQGWVNLQQTTLLWISGGIVLLNLVPAITSLFKGDIDETPSSEDIPDSIDENGKTVNDCGCEGSTVVVRTKRWPASDTVTRMRCSDALDYVAGKPKKREIIGC